jgi:predicted ATPase/DNA-binding CsgD family transcriptional regulator
MSEATNLHDDPERSTVESERGSRVASLRMRAPDRPPDNLPHELSSFVGREEALTEIERLLSSHRLVTLTGPGGSGKTRLALQVGRGLAEAFADGTWIVELASLSDPELVEPAVASALGVREAPGRTLGEQLVEHLRSKMMLLVVDNCEHLIEACAALAGALLGVCPDLRILATSREALGVAGEVCWLVPPLSSPEHPPAAVEELAGCEAVRLFVERANAVVTSFELDEENAPAVAEVCRQLDGIPLAIELAAVRTKVLSVEQISARLDESFGLLRSASRTAPPRQQTLRATMDWGYDLLPEEEKALFRELAVFAGGFTLAAVEEVCGSVEKDDVLELLSRLVDKSLVVVGRWNGEARYRSLEMVRQYASEKLEESKDAEEVRRRHAVWFVALTERAELQGPRQVEWLERLGAEYGNLRAAMCWLLGKGEIATAVRLAWALWYFWLLSREHLGEGRRWVEEILTRSEALPADPRAKALYLGAAVSYGYDSPERIQRLLEESAPLFRLAGNRQGEAIVMGSLAFPLWMQGDVEQAATLLEESVGTLREVGDEWHASFMLAHLGIIYLNRGDRARAERYLEESLVLSRRVGQKFSTCTSLYNLGLIAQAGGDRERAARMYAGGLELAVDMDDKADAAYFMEGLAEVAGERGEPERAVRLFAAAEALLEAAGTPLYVHAHDRALHERAKDALRYRLNETTFEAARAEGRAMTPEGAVAYALDEPLGEEDTRPSAAKAPPDGLTAREAEVIGHLARGKTNKQIAADLVLSVSTVERHVSNIYAKIGARGRAEATAYALSRGITTKH